MAKPASSGPANKSAWRGSGAAEIVAEKAEHGGYTLAEIDEIADSIELWARLHGKVRELVTQELIPFDPRPLQRRIWRQYEHCRDVDAPFRAVVCKVRRGGGSTAAECILYVHAHNYQARMGAVGTDDTVAHNMYDFISTFDANDDFPGWQRASKKLDGIGEITWPNGSKWEKYTAANPEAARSAGLQGYHASEVGRWQEGGAMDAHETLKSMLGAVPKRGFTVAIEESTAQGAAGAFYKRFASARWPTHDELGCEEGQEWWRKWEDETPQNRIELGETLQFVRIFAGWFEDDENKMPVTARDVAHLERTLDEKERALIARYQVEAAHGHCIGDTVSVATTWEQLAWRRSVIASEFDGDVEGFEQEYPSSPKEAFASSGRHSFNVAGCAHMIQVAKSSHPEYGVLTEQHDGQVVFTRTDFGEAWLWVWEPPRVGHRYIGAVDTMEGAEQVVGSKTHDYHAGVIIRSAFVDSDRVKQPHKIVATIQPKSMVEPDVLVHQMNLLSRWYGRCLVAPEVNRSGYAFLLHAKKLGMNLYRRETVDLYSSEVTDKAGWETTDKTRPQIISTMQALIRANAREETRCDGLECPSVTVARECSTMVKNAKGKDEAASGCHDDHVIATGIAMVNISGATYFSGHKRKRRGPEDRRSWQRAGR